MENLRYLLSAYSPDHPYYLGCRLRANLTPVINVSLITVSLNQNLNVNFLVIYVWWCWVRFK